MMMMMMIPLISPNFANVPNVKRPPDSPTWKPCRGSIATPWRRAVGHWNARGLWSVSHSITTFKIASHGVTSLAFPTFRGTPNWAPNWEKPMLGTLGIQDFALILAHGASPFASGCDDTTICSILILLGRRAWIRVGVSRNGWFGGTPISGTPLVGSGHHCFGNWVFFGCFNFPLFSMCVHQIPISVCPQFFFFDQITFNAHFNGLVKSSILLKFPYVCHHFMVKSVKSSSFCFSQITSQLTLFAGPSRRTERKAAGKCRKKGGGEVGIRGLPRTPWKMVVLFGFEWDWTRQNGGTCWFHHETWRFHMVETMVLVSLSHSLPFYGRKTPPKLNKLPQKPK